MTPPTLKYCSFDEDRHGNARWYARKRINGKFRKARIRADMPATGVPSPEFMAAYWAALEQLDGVATKSVPAPRADSFAWLWDQYQRSPAWVAYDRLTQADKRSVLGRWVAPIADMPFRRYRQQDVKASQEKRRATPAAADKLVNYLRAFFDWAIDAGHLASNPAHGIKKLHKTIGWHTWTDAEMDQFRSFYAVGTQARLAFELMLQVGARISDAARLGRQHESDGVLSFVAHKNRKRSPRQIDIPIRRELRAAMVPGVVGDLTYLVTEAGAAFSIKGLGNKFADWCKAASLPEKCRAHGLRKAAATALAESGCSASELMAIFGWARLETAEVYVRAANRKRMAATGIARLDEHRQNKSVPLHGPKKAGGTIRRKSHD